MIRIYPVGDVLGIEGKLKNVTASFKKCDVFFLFFKSNIVLITIMIINKESNEIYYSIVLIKYI